MNEIERKREEPSNKKLLAIVMIIIGIGIILYLVFIGFGSGGRDDNASKSDIARISQEQPVVLFFWGQGCAPCQEQKPVIEDLEDHYENLNVTFYWFDASRHNDLTDHYDIYGVPTTIVLNQTGSVKTFVGFSDYNSISAAIEDAIKSYEN